MKHQDSAQDEPTVSCVWEDESKSLLEDLEFQESFSDYSVLDGTLPCPCQGPIMRTDQCDVEIIFPKFLPCKCGKHAMVVDEEQHPNSFNGAKDDGSVVDLEKILRPWQVEFLNFYKITTIRKFVKMHKYKADDLARALKKWCKNHLELNIRTKKCEVALYVWVKSCAATRKLVKLTARRLSTSSSCSDQSDDDCVSVGSINPLRNQIFEIYSKEKPTRPSGSKISSPCDTFENELPMTEMACG